MDAALNVVLILGIVLAISSVGYGVMMSADGEQFSEFYLLTEDEDGELIADNYPSEFDQDENQHLIVGISNHEYETADYTVVVQLQRIEQEGNETTVLEHQELNQFQTRLAHNETWHHDHEVTPPISGRTYG